MKNYSDHSNTFFFFDYETWGVNPALDKPSQFAGVRTDENFNIIDDPITIYCQLPSDYLPSAKAALITGITPQKANQLGLTENLFIKQIHEQLSKPKTISLGYNNIRFDDEVTRYTCYRNFIDPYAWSWQNGNSRWDLLDVMRAAHALRPEGINWPQNDDGTISFKLEHLSVANGIEHSNAHDAMADVIATIELAKKLKQAQPKLFDYFLQQRHKNSLKLLIDLVNFTPLTHISGMFGNRKQYTSLVAPIIYHPINANAVVMLDLSGDINQLLELSTEQLHHRMYTKKEDLQGSFVPLKLVHLNKCPILATAKLITNEIAQKINLTRTLCDNNAKMLKEHANLIQTKVTELFKIKTNFTEHDDVETKLYDGFFNPQDRHVMDQILHSTPEQLAILDTSHLDWRIAPLLWRYRARNFPHTLTEHEQQKWRWHCQEKIEQQQYEYIENLKLLFSENKNDPQKLQTLQQVYNYVSTMFS